ncbi:MAG: STAS domain-containing protein [Clostridiaceae bacterium]|nr:STAS domain-containing protein [Clostridiaceae bacterium]
MNMEFTKTKQNNRLTVAVTGRIDTETGGELAELSYEFDGIRELIFDFTNVEYISSYGLRILLDFQKHMSSEKKVMKILHPNKTVMQVFEMTGFNKILTIE